MSDFDRAQQRHPSTKAFAYAENDLKGASKVEAYNKDANFVQAKELNKACSVYAMAYADTLLQRLETEQPEYFKESEMSRGELTAHLVNNICYPVTKAYSRQFRETTANMFEKKHLTDQIRRMNNGGDKFHPYL